MITRHRISTGSIWIFLLFLGILFFVWYPAPYFAIDGGWTVLLILGGAHLALGPLLTLIVFKPGKSGLKPADPQQRQELLFGVLLEGQKDWEYRAEFYEPYRPDLAHLRARSIDLEKIAARDATAQAAIDAFAEQHDGRLDDYFYLPLRGKNQDFVLALSATDGMPAGWIPISPWLEDYRGP